MKDVKNTLPETNISTENGCLEDEISFWDGLTVSFKEGSSLKVDSLGFYTPEDSRIEPEVMMVVWFRWFSTTPGGPYSQVPAINRLGCMVF